MKKIILILFFAFISSLIFADEISNSLSPYQESPRVLYKPSPIYPKEALKKQLSGKVYVKALVNTKNGNVIKAEILRSDNTVFNKPALDAARKTIFEPNFYNGTATNVYFGMCYTFQIIDNINAYHFGIVFPYKIMKQFIEAYEVYSPPAFQHRGNYNIPEEYKTLEYIPPVIVSVLVGEDGKPKEVKLRVGGIKNMHDDLLNAAMSSTFKPAQKDGKAVEAWHDIVFDFNK